jgi:hypothetical protein
MYVNIKSKPKNVLITHIAIICIDKTSYENQKEKPYHLE